jgi:uncharacterized damage-inducible protein DinB
MATASRAELIAWLADARADLLAQLAGLDERILCEEPVMAQWTAKDLLAHVAYWDAFFAEMVGIALAGRAAEVPDVSLDERNALVYAERRAWPLSLALETLTRARVGFLEAFEQAPLDALDIEYAFGWGRASLRRIARWRGYHDSDHAAQIAAWRESK